MEWTNASAQLIVAGDIPFLSYSSVHLCVHPETLLTRYLAFSPNLHQRCIMGQRWTRHSLGSKGQRSRWNKVCWKQYFLGLLTWCLEKYWSDFHQTYTNDVLWDRDECVKFWGQKVEVQGHGGITYAGTITPQAEAYSTRVRLNFLVSRETLLTALDQGKLICAWWMNLSTWNFDPIM